MTDPSVTQQVKFDAICMQFEKAWRERENPAIESFLDSMSEAERPLLLAQILLLELEYIEGTGTSPEVEEYLERFPNDEAAVRGAFKAHLAALAESGAVSEHPNDEGTLDQQPISEREGSQIGRYKLLEQIGEGGMGVVYMAEQQRPVRRKVALKIIKPGMDTRQVIARFEAERQTLAMMDHPNIARVLDAGSTDCGRPYFVMELVRGTTMVEFCDATKLDTNERLKLFKLVCQAVQHAHTKGIIHRDLKPTNVLVTLHDGVPVPKIIDFGVSKAMGQQLTDKTMFTAFSQMVGTPLYMSPEQAEMSGLDIDTRSDIYSLGVLLYELLTGVTPFDRKRLHTVALDELRRIIREEEPEKPSTRVSSLGESSATVSAQRSTDPVKLKQLLRGELDWIVMKTLEKDRNRRYETANALVAEIDRYMAGEPVNACPPSTIYRFQKFARRHKARAAVASLFLLLLLASSVVGWVLFASAQRAKELAVAKSNEAIRERQRAEDARDEIQAQTNEVQTQKDVAEHNLQRALAEEKKAASLATQLQRRLYDYHLSKAAAAYDRDEPHKTAELLDQCLIEQRGWEWHRLETLTRAGRKIELDGVIAGIAVSPNAPQAALQDMSGNLRLFDFSQGQTIWKHPTKARGPAVFSPVGDLIAVFSEPNRAGGRLEIWETSGRRLWTAEYGSRAVGWVALSSDGRFLAVSTIDSKSGVGMIALHEPRTPTPIWKQPCDGMAIMTFDAKAEHLFLTLTRSGDPASSSKLCCWGINERDEIWSVERGTASVPCMSPEGSVLVGGSNHSLEVRDAASGEILEVLPSSGSGTAVFVRSSPDGRHLVTVAMSGEVVLWDWHGRAEKELLRLPPLPAFGTSFSHEGQCVFTDGSNLELRTVDRAPAALVLSGHDGAVRGVAFSPDGRQVLSTGFDGTLRTWNTATGQEVHTNSIGGTLLAVTYSPTGEYFATGSEQDVSLWNAATGELVHRWPEARRVRSLQFSPDGQQLIAGILRRGDGLKILDVANRRKVIERELPTTHGATFSADGRRALSLTIPFGQLDLWDMESSGPPHTLRPGKEEGRTELDWGLALVRIPHRLGALSGESGLSNLIAAAIGRTIEIWDIDERKQVMTLRGPEDIFSCLAVSPDGLRLFAGDEVGFVRIWNLTTGEQLLTIPAHEVVPDVPRWGRRGVMSIALSPDGKTLATTGADGLVKLWETTYPSPAVARQRLIVAEATALVNQQYNKSPRQRQVMTSLMSDTSLDKKVLQVAIDIANTRGDRQLDTKEALKEINESLSTSPELARQLLIMIVESESGISVDEPRVITRSANGWSWYGKAESLALRFTQPEYNGLLTHMVNAYPNAHHFVYLRGLGSARRGKWREAERDLTMSLARVPEQSAVWHIQACHLGRLYLFLGDVDKYRTLCETTLRDFENTMNPLHGERTGMLCVLSARNTVNLVRAESMIDVALAHREHESFPYFALAKGVAEYRRGDHRSALDYLAIAEKQKLSTTLGVRALCYRSLCLQKAEEPERAREALTAAEQIINSDTYPQPDGGEFPVGWPDWIAAQLAYQEAVKEIR